MNTFSAEYFHNPLRARYSMTNELRSLIMQIPAESKVLDLGCGDMKLLLEIAEIRPDLHLHGVDIGDINIGSGNIEFTNADVTTFVSDTKYQVVLAIDILEHLPQPERLVRTALDSLVPGGKFYTTVPSVTKLLMFGDDNFFSDYSHIRPFSCKSMVRLLTDHGFEVISSVAVGQGQLTFLKRGYYLARGLLTSNPSYINGFIRMIGGTAIETIAKKRNTENLVNL